VMGRKGELNPASNIASAQVEDEIFESGRRCATDGHRLHAGLGLLL
jgi:hypothetical protein